MWNVNIFSIGDLDHDFFFSRNARENDEDIIRPAFDDEDDLFCRIDELKEIIKRCKAELIYLENYGSNLCGCHTWGDLDDNLHYNLDIKEIKKIEDKIKKERIELFSAATTNKRL